MAQDWASINRRRRAFVTKYSRLWFWEYLQMGREYAKELRKFGEQAQLPQIDLIKLWEDMYAEVGVAFARDSRREFKKLITKSDEEMLDDEWVRRMKLYATEEAGRFIKTITHTAREEMYNIVGRILEEGFEEGLSRDKIANLIADRFFDEWGTASKWMGRRVAQTEIIRASNYGVLQGVKSLGVPYDRVWYTGGPNIRDTHLAAHGQVVDESEPFTIGDSQCMYPGDPQLPAEESINCKCAVSARPKGGY